MDYMLDPLDEDELELPELSIDDIDPEDSDFYMYAEAAANASSCWQNSRNL